MSQVFLSYAHANTNEANRVREGLEALGISVWIDHSDLRANADISSAIDERIRKVSAVLVVWSSASKESVWVRAEAMAGFAARKYIGCQLEQMTPPVPFNIQNAPDLSDWTGLNDHRAWGNLVRSVAEMLPANKEDIVARLDKLRLAERAKEDNAVAAQMALPIENQIAEEPELAEEHAYKDVDALLAAAEAILKNEGKHDLDVTIVQAAFNHEILRDARFVVGADAALVTPGPITRCASLKEAVERAADGDTIAVCPGTFVENIKIEKAIRIVGLGLGNERPVLKAATDNPVLQFQASARVENLNIETDKAHPAVHCAPERQPVLIRCTIRRYSKGRDSSAFHVAGRANPIVVACTIASTDVAGIHFVQGSGGTFLGGSVTGYRGVAIVSYGRPKFKMCSIDATGGHAVEIRSGGGPTFESCEISGKGASVIKICRKAYPQIRDSRLNALRQLAFDFDEESYGRYERNIVDFVPPPEEPVQSQPNGGIFGMFRAKNNALVASAQKSRRIISVKNSSRPVFVLNILTDGEALELPSSPGATRH